MKKSSSNDDIRQQIIGLGDKSVRKNYYRLLMDKQKKLEQSNEELKAEIEKRKDIESELMRLNTELEEIVQRRTQALEASNSSLKSHVEKLEKTQAYLIKIEKIAALSTLVQGIAHEINTPLGTSITTISYAHDKLKQLLKSIPENQAEKFSHILEAQELATEAVLQAGELVNNFKKISSDQQEYRLVLFNFYDYIHIVMSSMSILQNHPAQINIYGDRNLTIYGYPGVLSQTISSLISNSIEHACVDDLQIDIFFNPYKQGIEFVYQDNGIGCKEETLNHLFNPFFTTSNMSNHSGLGLYTLHNIISNVLKGEIHVENRSNGGLRFLVFAPNQKS